MKKLFSIFLIVFSTISAAESTKEFVDISTINPHIKLDLRYATTNNFTGKVLYAAPICYVLKPVAHALDNIQKELEKKGLGLLIWDGYRPLSVQYEMRKYVPQSQYVGNPKKGGRHTRGTAVDVTIITKDGKELDMGTEFDEFSERARRNYTKFPEKVLANRTLLDTIMRKHGFTGMPSEWWHYDFKNWREYEPMDIPINQIAQRE